MQATITVMPFMHRGAVSGLQLLFQPSNASARFNEDLNQLGFMGNLTPQGDVSGTYTKRKGGKSPSETIADLMEWVWAHRSDAVVHIRPSVKKGR